MMPIWDEEWAVFDDGSALVRDANNGREIAVFDVPVTEDDPRFQEKAELADRRAQLAAQAPAMARLLLELEWDGDGWRSFCLTCQSPEPRHAPDCRWLAVMRAAGVRD